MLIFILVGIFLSMRDLEIGSSNNNNIFFYVGFSKLILRIKVNK